jgi:tripartite-type tricarboxylate transporter receptor subunit TctC
LRSTHRSIPKLPYDTVKDLAALSMVGEQPNVLVVHPSVPAHSVRELLDLTKASPRRLNYGSGGFGSSTYLATELLKLMTKADIVHVPYKGVGPALTALLAGEVHLFFSTLGPALPQIKAGRLRALGVTSLKRSAYLASVPTISEAGVPGYEYSTWYGIWLPSGTPRAIAHRLYRETEQLVLSAEIREEFAAQGVDRRSCRRTSSKRFAGQKSKNGPRSYGRPARSQNDFCAKYGTLHLSKAMLVGAAACAFSQGYAAETPYPPGTS